MVEIADLFPDSDPVVRVEGDSVTVVLTVPAYGTVAWLFEAVEVRRKDFDSQLSIQIDAHIPGYEQDYPSTHFSGGSPSARDTWRRNLESMYGKDMDWPKLLVKAYSLARTAYLEAAQTVDLDDIEIDWESTYFVDGLWASEGTTILFGQGSAGKGHLTQAVVNSVLSGTRFLGRDASWGNVLYLDYEASERVMARRRNRHMIGWNDPIRGRFHYLPSRGIGVADQIDAVRRELRRTNSHALVVDSAVPALGGGDPTKPEVVARMFNALNTLTVPVWMIAHITKQGDEEYPFGSVFWHNLARMTWFIRKVDDEESPNIDVALANKKVNEGRKQSAFGARIRFDDPTGPIEVVPYDLMSAPETARYVSLSKRMYDLLSRPMLTSAIAKELGTDDAQVRNAGKRHPQLHSVAIPGEKEKTWSRVPVA